MPHRWFVVEQFGREDFDEFIVGDFRFHRVIVFKRPLPRVATPIEVPSLVEIPVVLVRLGKRKEEVDQRLLGNVLLVNRLLHGAYVIGR